MKDSNKYRNYDFIELVETLYGYKDYKKVKNFIDFATQKKYYLKIWRTFEVAFFNTIEIIDSIHLEKIKNEFLSGKNLLENQSEKENLESTFILCQTKLVLNLLGGFEDLQMTSDYLSRTKRKSDWKLNQHRSISYSQNLTQKVQVIGHLSLKRKISLSYENFHSKLIEFYYDSIKFLAFFRQTFPEEYSEIF